jgi:hypothetical protein
LPEATISLASHSLASSVCSERTLIGSASPGSYVAVAVFDDRIEVRSFGRLPQGVVAAHPGAPDAGCVRPNSVRHKNSATTPTLLANARSTHPQAWSPGRKLGPNHAAAPASRSGTSRVRENQRTGNSSGSPKQTNAMLFAIRCASGGTGSFSDITV